MTREEALHKAINIVRYFEAHFAKSKEAREDAVNIIEVLEQELIDNDCISRKETIDWLKRVTVTEGITFGTGFKQILHDIEQMPSVKQEQYYKDLANSYEKTINKLTKAISEQEPKIEDKWYGLLDAHGGDI